MSLIRKGVSDNDHRVDLHTTEGILKTRKSKYYRSGVLKAMLSVGLITPAEWNVFYLKYVGELKEIK